MLPKVSHASELCGHELLCWATTSVDLAWECCENTGSGREQHQHLHAHLSTHWSPLATHIHTQTYIHSDDTQERTSMSPHATRPSKRVCQLDPNTIIPLGLIFRMALNSHDTRILITPLVGVYVEHTPTLIHPYTYTNVCDSGTKDTQDVLALIKNHFYLGFRAVFSWLRREKWF